MLLVLWRSVKRPHGWGFGKSPGLEVIQAFVIKNSNLLTRLNLSYFSMGTCWKSSKTKLCSYFIRSMRHASITVA